MGWPPPAAGPAASRSCISSPPRLPGTGGRWGRSRRGRGPARCSAPAERLTFGSTADLQELAGASCPTVSAGRDLEVGWHPGASSPVCPALGVRRVSACTHIVSELVLHPNGVGKQLWGHVVPLGSGRVSSRCPCDQGSLRNPELRTEFPRRPDGRYFRLGGPCSLCHSLSVAEPSGGHGQHTRRGPGPPSLRAGHGRRGCPGTACWLACPQSLRGGGGSSVRPFLNHSRR